MENSTPMYASTSCSFFSVASRTNSKGMAALVETRPPSESVNFFFMNMMRSSSLRGGRPMLPRMMDTVSMKPSASTVMPECWICDYESTIVIVPVTFSPGS